MEERRYTYIKKPFARKSFFCLPLSVLSLALFAVSLGLSVRLQGQGGLNVAAWGFSSFVFAAAAMAYGVMSLFEREMNYILSKIGMGISGLLIVFWICMIVVGLIG